MTGPKVGLIVEAFDTLTEADDAAEQYQHSPDATVRVEEAETDLPIYEGLMKEVFRW